MKHEAGLFMGIGFVLLVLGLITLDKGTSPRLDVIDVAAIIAGLVVGLVIKEC